MSNRVVEAIERMTEQGYSAWMIEQCARVIMDDLDDDDFDLVYDETR